MDVAMKDPAIMSMFTEGSHHKSVSVIFLSQNIFHQGKHSRTMSLNVQYMVIFKNVRDKAQIQTLARQMYPSDWRSFLQHFESETSKEYGHIIIDLHPSTPDDQRVVSTLQQSTPTQSLSEQYYDMANPYAQPLMEAQKKMQEILYSDHLSDEMKVKEHVNALRLYTIMRDKYKTQGDGSPVLKSIELPDESRNNATIPTQNQIKETHSTPVKKIREERKDAPPGIYLNENELDTSDPHQMMYGKVLPDGTDPKLLSFADTDKERENKMEYIRKHIFKEEVMVDPEPSPGENPALLSFTDTKEERAAKQRYIDHIKDNSKEYDLRRKKTGT